MDFCTFVPYFRKDKVKSISVRRYFIYLGYNGKNFRGWQIQPNGMTVQQSIEEALAILMRKPVPIVGAGRTDAGVHARLMGRTDQGKPNPRSVLPILIGKDRSRIWLSLRKN